MPKSSGKGTNNFCYGNYETLNSVDRFCGKLSNIFFSGEVINPCQREVYTRH